MSLNRNIAINYFSQAYIGIISILLIPQYIKILGAEAYGLIGFFAMLQMLFNFLDLGLTPTMSRETTRYYGGAISETEFHSFYKTLSAMFILVAFVGGGILWISAGTISNKWLRVENLSHLEVLFAVQAMALSVALRWMGGIYRGIIIGAERLTLLSGFNICIATMRFIMVFAVMHVFGETVKVFFFYQLIISAIELFVLWRIAKGFLPKLSEKKETPLNLTVLLPKLRFALVIAFTSSIWLLSTQTDKFLLSGMLSLSEYGYFTMVVLLASAINVISGPIANALMPRLTRLYAEGKEQELISAYRRVTRLAVVVGGACALTVATFSESILLIWTKNPVVSRDVANILVLYALGNGLLIIGAFPYYLQYAKGSLRLHLITNILTILFSLPAVYYFTLEYGAVGAGWVWVIINLFNLMIWSMYIHKFYLEKIHKQWLIVDIIFVLFPGILVAYTLKLITKLNGDFIVDTLIIIINGLLILTVMAMANKLIVKYKI